MRQPRKFVSQMTPWAAGVASVPLEVVIDNISETGIGLVHGQALPLCMRYQVTVPKGDGHTVMREYVVVRCDQRGDGNFAIGLEQSIERASVDEEPRRITTSTTKLLFLLFGIFGLLIAVFAPM